MTDVSTDTKACKQCKRVFPLSGYSVQSQNPHTMKIYYQTSCRTCVRNKYVKQGYRKTKLDMNPNLKQALEADLRAGVPRKLVASNNNITYSCLCNYLKKGLLDVTTEAEDTPQ